MWEGPEYVGLLGRPIATSAHPDAVWDRTITKRRLLIGGQRAPRFDTRMLYVLGVRGFLAS